MSERRPVPWERDWPEEDLPDVAGAQFGETHADNLRHAHLRAYFLNALLADPRVAEALKTWGPNRVAEDAARFVLDVLKLRWGWLAWELARGATTCADITDALRRRGLGGDVEVRWTYSVDATEPPAPRLAWRLDFMTREGETVSEARARLRATEAEARRAYADALHALDQAERQARGRRPKRETAYLKQWAEWFYRSRVKVPRDSIGALAREYRGRRAGGNTTDRKTVEDAIRNAERLLGAAGHDLKRTPLRE